MINKHDSRRQTLQKLQLICRVSKNRETILKAKSWGHWDSRIAQADPDPEMITNSHYWEAYCEGMYQRYLEKYGINRSN